MSGGIFSDPNMPRDISLRDGHQKIYNEGKPIMGKFLLNWNSHYCSDCGEDSYFLTFWLVKENKPEKVSHYCKCKRITGVKK